MKKITTVLLASACMMAACGGASEKEAQKDNGAAQEQLSEPAVKIPAFNADSAYAYVAKQVSFGPRIPNSDAQRKCADWMIATLKQWADDVHVQETTVKGGDGKSLKCINVIASFNPQVQKRVMLMSHWDTRPWTDEDPANPTGKLDGADDGASGVGVLMELARMFKGQKPDVGVDIVFTDVEDYGKSEHGEASYALGTQYWAKNPHVPNYKASYGILLDMVGGKNATFPMEGYSLQYAPDIVRGVWNAAASLGYGNVFQQQQGGTITDDHYFVNTIAGIPTIDIIGLRNSPSSPFQEHWHTSKDNMDVIDRVTLKKVGETVAKVVYENNL
jgi:hypothetical protein